MSGAHLREQLGDDGGDALEEVRAELVLQAGHGRASGTIRVANPSGYITPTVAVPRRDRPAPQPARKVGCEGAGIGREILGRRELRRVDEDRHDDPVGATAGAPHQRQMAVVQRAHGRDQRDLLTGVTPARNAAAQRDDRSALPLAVEPCSILRDASKLGTGRFVAKTSRSTTTVNQRAQVRVQFLLTLTQMHPDYGASRVV